MTSLTGNSFIERRWALLVLIALAFRALYAFYHYETSGEKTKIGTFAIVTGDTDSYLVPVENYMAHDRYTPDYRMPGVGLPYFVFRQFMDPRTSRDALVIMQWLLSGISVYLLALITFRWTGSSRTAMIVYVLFLLSAYSSWYDSSIASDSFSVTVLIIQVYLFQLALDRQRLWLMVLVGLLMAWLVFLRPVCAALVPVGAFFVFRYWKGGRGLRTAVLFLLPFAVLDGAWTFRNWRVNHEFNPLTNEGVMPKYITGGVRYPVETFIQTYGGTLIWWAPGSNMRWFGIWKGGAALDDEGRKADPPGEYAYVPAYNKDSLMWIASNIRMLSSKTMSYDDSTALADVVVAKLHRYSEAYKVGAPFNYQVLSRLRLLWIELDQNGTETILFKPFSEMPLWEKAFKLFQALLFKFSLIMGIAAILFLRWVPGGEGTVLRRWVPLFAMFTMLIYPLVFRVPEWRYLVMIFPLLLMMAVIGSTHIVRVVRGRMAKAA